MPEPTAYDQRARQSSDRGARVVVWTVWVALLALLVWLTASVVSPLPLAEDWLAVSPLTGHEPSLAAWLWAQNNEHRMPIARLLLLGALKAAGGDYRAGAYLNLVLLALAAAGLIWFARQLRGRTDLADVVFPLLLLHFGQSNQVLFSWQLTFVLSIVFILALGCALFAPGSVSRPVPAAVAGGVLLLLPLSGFIGLLFVPSTLAYLVYAGWACRGGRRGWPDRPGTGSWLLAAAGGSVLLTALYFIGYEHPWWNPPSPGLVPSAKVALKVLSLGFGPAPEFWWAPGVIGAVLLLGGSLWLAVRRLRPGGPARDHAAGAALFLVNAIAFATVVGWGRAAYVPEFGIPIRYVMLVLPAFVACDLTLIAVASPAGRAAQRALALVMLILLPFNTVAGYRFFADWYGEGMRRVEADLARDLPLDEVSARHQRFLVHWWTPGELARNMRWLREAGVARFAPPAQSGISGGS